MLRKIDSASIRVINCCKKKDIGIFSGIISVTKTLRFEAIIQSIFHFACLSHGR